MFYAKKSTIKELRNFINALTEYAVDVDVFYDPYYGALSQGKIPYNGDGSSTFGVEDADYNGVMFALDNFVSPNETDDFANGDHGSYGYKQIGDFAVAFCNGCGDWEWPAVNFVLYIGSDNKIHAYTPTEGNTYNKITGTAYSNSLVYSINKDKLDKWFKFALENGFIEDYDERMNVTEDFYCSGEKYDKFIENVIKSENLDKMIEDIKKNIIVTE